MKSAHKNRDFLTGQTLIAMPNMSDPRFERSVVLVCSHADDHAMGIVVNKRIDGAHFGDLIAQLKIKGRPHLDEEPIFYGGPVQQERGLIVHTLDYECDETMIINQHIGITGTKRILNDIADETRTVTAPSKYLFALGHAGWSGGQLEEEIAMNAWAHGAADEEIVFSGGGEDVWTRALANLGVTGAMLSPEWSTPRSDDTPLH